jgi:hypothetical protein
VCFTACNWHFLIFKERRYTNWGLLVRSDARWNKWTHQVSSSSRMLWLADDDWQ